MLRALVIVVAIGFVMGSVPALAYKMSCEEYCRTKICITTLSPVSLLACRSV